MAEFKKCIPHTILIIFVMLGLCISFYYIGKHSVESKVVKIQIPVPVTNESSYPISKVIKDSLIASSKQKAIENVKPIIHYLDSTTKEIVETNNEQKVNADVEVNKQSFYSNNLLQIKIDSLTELVNYYKSMNEANSKVITIHDTINNPLPVFIKPEVADYFGLKEAQKLGLGQNPIPLYGIRGQLLFSMRLKPFIQYSIGGGIRYDYNLFSTLFAYYYNLSTKQSTMTINTRFDAFRLGKSPFNKIKNN